MSVTLIAHMGSDEMIARAAWVSTQTDQRDASPQAVEKLIRFLLSNRPVHASPFAHPHLTVLVECPIFVAREWMRHRVWSYSEVSSRYSDLSGESYVPPLEDMRHQTGKPGEYRMEPMDERNAQGMRVLMRDAYDRAVLRYEQMLHRGLAREVARNVLPLGTMTRFYGTVSLRNALNFLVLRDDPSALLEIRREAETLRVILETLFPITLKVWLEEGRPQL